MKSTKFNLITLATLALALSPKLALAHPTTITGGHAHNISFHDHTPHIHDHTPVGHH